MAAREPENLPGSSPEFIKNWRRFFPFEDGTETDWLNALDDQLPPHLALLLSFLQLYKEPQKLINDFTERHLNYYYRDILQMTSLPARPDHVHLAGTLKKGANPILITREMQFPAGKDSTGKDLIYRPVREVVMNHASVTSVRSAFLDKNGVFRYAPIADSLDGLGTIDKDAPLVWSAFGQPSLPIGESGFAFSAPVLKMAEGARRITVEITSSELFKLNAETDLLDSAFSVYLTGSKAWMGPYTQTPELDGDVLRFSVSVEDSEGAIVDFQQKVHGYNYAADAPVLKVLLNPDKGGGSSHLAFQQLELNSITINVEVSGMKTLLLSNDFGALNPEKKFTPFGPEPKKGARFRVGSEEVFSKQLTSLALDILWADVPGNLATHYSGYDHDSDIDNTTFVANISFPDIGISSPSETIGLFDIESAGNRRKIVFDNTSGATPEQTTVNPFVYSLILANSTWAHIAFDQYSLASPARASSSAGKPEPRPGEMALTLEEDFFHEEYRKQYVKRVVEFSKGQTSTINMLNEPVVPAIQEISLAYSASTGAINMRENTQQSFADTNLQFYQIGYFGQMREHRYSRGQFDFVSGKSVTLLNRISSQGELLVGLTGIDTGDTVSILFQVSEGSANPDLPPAGIEWSVLCDNYWKLLAPGEIILDTTNHFLRSGIVQFKIPREATATNTLLPAGSIWLKGELDGEQSAVCQFRKIVANTLELEFDYQGNNPTHLFTALPAGSIKNTKTGNPAIKQFVQEYSSFGGAPEERQEAFKTRVSERLRHKNRCISPWDFERKILQCFPNVHKVKCIPHARPGNWSAPGHVMLVLVPDLRNRNAIDPLRPRVDSNTVQQVTTMVQRAYRNGNRNTCEEPAISGGGR